MFLITVINCILRIRFLLTKTGPYVKQKTVYITSADGARIRLYLFEPRDAAGNKLPLIQYNHGGGFQLGIISYQKENACNLVQKHHLRVMMPDYRLLPKHPFPCAVEDCYAALSWAAANADALGVDLDRVGVLGSSAGACISAALTHMARDRKGPKISFQMLSFPVVDSTCSSESMRKFPDTPNWDAELNRLMWKKYLKNGNCGLPGYASPLCNSEFSNLPRAYIETAEFDCLCDEGLQYAKALWAAGVKVVLNETKGTVHGYDQIRKSQITQEGFEFRDKFIRDSISV